MAKTFWIHIALISIFLVLMVASKKRGGEGSSRSGGSKSGGHHNSSSEGNNGGKLNTSHTGNTGSNWDPHYRANPGSNWSPGGGGSWGNNYNPGGSNYSKHFKPPKSKTNMKYMAGAATAGEVGGFMLGNAVSNMKYRFDNDMDYRYYNSYQNQMPRQVYHPMYEDSSEVTQDRFVTDCYNMSMTEYVIKPNEGKNVSEIDQTEVRVKSSVIRQLCVSEYKREPAYYQGSGLNLLFSPSLIFFIMLFLYFVVE